MGFTDLEPIKVGALEAHGFQVKKPRMRDVGELVIWKPTSVSLLREREPLTLPHSLTNCLWLLQPHPAPDTPDEHLPVHLPDSSKSPLPQ